MDKQLTFKAFDDQIEKDSSLLKFLKELVSDHSVEADGETMRFSGQFGFMRNVDKAWGEVGQFLDKDENVGSVEKIPHERAVAVVFKTPVNGIKKLIISIEKDQ